jgi:putative acetyltransferase
VTVTIEPEKPEDTKTIQALIALAFGQEDEAVLVDKLRENGDLTHSLIARDETGNIIGYLALSRLKSPEKSLALAPVAVHPAHQKQGIGDALIRKAIDDARKEGEALIFVLGDPAYYTRFGFSTETAAPFDCLYAGPYFMARELGEKSAEIAPVHYADAFGALK